MFWRATSIGGQARCMSPEGIAEMQYPERGFGGRCWPVPTP
jgi:hypothetical protein